MESYLKQLCEDVQSIARKAGQNMLDHVGIEVEKEKVNFSDLCTKVDTDNQAMIEKFMKDHYPEHVLLGEEGIAWGDDISAIDARKDKEWMWIVDPVDGTTNFVHTLPTSVVSIAVSQNEKVMVGVVYDPYRNEMFSAIRGCGAFCNGKPIHVANQDCLKHSLLAFGTNYTANIRHCMLRGMCHIADLVRGTRCLGSAALHLSYVACGRFTGWWELGLHAWDLAAGALLVEEAGGRVSSCTGVPYTIRVFDCMATNGLIHDEFIDELNKCKGNEFIDTD
ncbi:hypothetical protein WA158_005528 [Blastocystis sp. Blastoise]